MLSNWSEPVNSQAKSPRGSVSQLCKKEIGEMKLRGSRNGWCGRCVCVPFRQLFYSPLDWYVHPKRASSILSRNCV